MIKVTILFTAMSLLSASIIAQVTNAALEKNKAFTGAESTKKSYHAICQLDTNDSMVVTKAMISINNALADPRLAGKIQIELIAFAGGTDIYMKGSKYENDLKSLIEKGVIVAQCNNTLIRRKISRDQLYDFIAVVPSANGELILRQADGWAIMKP